MPLTQLEYETLKTDVNAVIDEYAPVVVPPLPLPTITNMTALPASLPFGGGSVTIDATITDAESVTLDGVPITGLPQSVAVAGTGTITFTLVATNATGSTEATASVEVSAVAPLPLPTIENMTATPASLPYGGGAVVIDATVTDADSVTLDGLPVVLPATQQVTLSTTFTLVATNTTGDSLPATASVEVSTVALPPPLPTITGLSVSPSSLPVDGGPVVIDAVVTDATELRVNDVLIPSLPYSSAIARTTSFTLYAANVTGFVVDSVIAAVAPQPPPDEYAVLWDGASGVNANLFNVGALIPWQNRLGDWIDARGVEQGTTAFASSTTTVAGPFSFDATTLVRYLKANGRRGIFLKPTGYGSVSMRIHPNPAQRPSLTVDGVVYPCTASTVINQSTNNPMVGAALDAAQGVLLEFDLMAVPFDFTLATVNMYRPTAAAMTLKAFATRSPKLFSGGTPTNGLAVNYPLDDGIMAHPDVYFSSLFDATSAAQHFPGTKYYATSTYAIDPTLWGIPARGLQFPIGSFAPLVQGLWHVWSNKPGGGMKINPFNGLLLVDDTPSAQYKTLGHPHTPSELYFRYYIRFGPTYQCKPQSKKLPGLAGRYGFWTGNDGFGHYNVTAGNGGGKTYGTLDPNNHPAEGGSFSGWSLRHHAFNAPTDANPYRHRMPLEYYAYHVNMTGSFGDLWRWGNKAVGWANCEPERWYCLEHYVKLNDVVGPFDAAGNGTGVANGIVRGWLDGVLVFEKLNAVLRKHPAIKIDEVWMDFFHGGTTPAEAIHDLQIAAAVVARSYIGPLQSGTPATVQTTDI